MLLVGFGYAKPVPVNARYFKNVKYGMALTAVAGPITNLLLGMIATMLMFSCVVYATPLLNTLMGYALYRLIFYFAYLNLVLAVFNMIPLPPFDGSRVLFAFLPDKYYFGVMRYERYIMIAVLVLMSTDILPFSADDIAFNIMGAIGKLYGVVL
jgi:Zn-dependent protease